MLTSCPIIAQSVVHLKTTRKGFRFTAGSYLNDNNLLAKNLSAYRRFHSTETSLLRLISTRVSAVESGKRTRMPLRDMSAAFDTVDHDILF